MKKNLFFIYFLLPIILSAQSLRLYVYVDENENYGSDRSKDRRQDMKSIRAFWNNYANGINYNFIENINSTPNFYSSELRNDLSNLSIDENDIIVFYYSGHGSNSGIDDYPKLAFNYNKSGENGINSSEIYQSLKKLCQQKKSHSFYVFADCCNNISSTGNYNSNILRDMNYKYQSIYDKSKGIGYLISASNKGKFSLSNLDKGSIFRENFENIFLQTSTKTDASFQSILKSTQEVMKNNRYVVSGDNSYNFYPIFYYDNFSLDGKKSETTSLISTITISDQIDENDFIEKSIFYIGNEMKKVEIVLNKESPSYNFNISSSNTENIPWQMSATIQTIQNQILNFQGSGIITNYKNGDKFMLRINENKQIYLKKQ